MRLSSGSFAIDVKIGEDLVHIGRIIEQDEICRDSLRK
jgi:hypothetical protein